LLRIGCEASGRCDRLYFSPEGRSTGLVLLGKRAMLPWCRGLTPREENERIGCCFNDGGEGNSWRGVAIGKG